MRDYSSPSLGFKRMSLIINHIGTIDANWRIIIAVHFPSMLSVLAFSGCSATIYKSTKHRISVAVN